MRRFLILVLLIPLSILSGCAQKLQSISQDVDKTLAENSGYLLIGVETNWGLHKIFIGGDNSLMLTEEDLKLGSNYILVPVPAGHYRIEDVKFTRYVYMELEEGYWDFEVLPNQVSYVGDLSIEIKGLWKILSAEIILENRSTKALRFLEESFPNILQSRQVRYSGPGEDHFLEYAEGLGKSEETVL